MEKLFLIILFLWSCVTSCYTKELKPQNSTMQLRKSGCLNEDCCEELRLENIKRMNEIDLLSVKLDEEIHNRKAADLTFRSVPRGSILPWVPKPSKTAPHEEDIPDGFALCDGSAITEGPWANLHTPDLSNGRFLRGTTKNHVLDFEDDMMREHKHYDPGHYHSYTDYYDNVDSNQFSPSAHSGLQDLDGTHSTRHSYSAHTGISHVTGVSSHNIGNEVRPKNMKTMFIMKVR